MSEAPPWAWAKAAAGATTASSAAAAMAAEPPKRPGRFAAAVSAPRKDSALVDMFMQPRSAPDWRAIDLG